MDAAGLNELPVPKSLLKSNINSSCASRACSNIHISESSHVVSCVCSQPRHVYELAFALSEAIRAKSTLKDLVNKVVGRCDERAKHQRCNISLRVRHKEIHGRHDGLKSC